MRSRKKLFRYYCEVSKWINKFNRIWFEVEEFNNWIDKISFNDMLWRVRNDEKICCLIKVEENF